MTDKTRADFEEWLTKNRGYGALDRAATGGYVWVATSEAWEVWQAAQGKRQPQWLPIADAPRDGNLIDLWCVPPDDSEFEPTNGGIRLTGSWHDSNDIFPHTGWVRVMDDGNWDLINSPPLTLHGLPRWIPIYWRAEPLPPTATPQGKL